MKMMAEEANPTQHEKIVPAVVLGVLHEASDSGPVVVVSG